MLKGFYTAASGMIAQQRHQEALSNNIANVNTPGYKADQATFRAFPEMLLHELAAKQLPVEEGSNIPRRRPIGNLFTGAYAQEFVSDFSQGALRETGNQTDLSLLVQEVPDASGGLFFAVEEDGEMRLTRNGHFTVHVDGYLVTPEGQTVLGRDGNPIMTNGLDFTLTDDGMVQMDEEGLQALDIRYVEDVNQLEKEGQDLWNGASTPVIPDEAVFQVKQGYLEQSNVNPVQTMTEMMESYRLFETNQRVLKAYDSSMEKAVRDIGRIG